MLTIVAGVASDTGRKRKNNEDSWLVFEPKSKRLIKTKGRLYAVADGMGGAVAGEVASRLALDELKKQYFWGIQAALPEKCLEQAVLAAHEAVWRKAFAEPEYTGMGSTLTAVVLKDEAAHIAQVGDSRAYLVRGVTIKQLTRDHTVVANLVYKGELDPAEAWNHPQRHVLTQALGSRKEITVELRSYPVGAGDILILCTDGLYNLVLEEDIRDTVTATSNCQEAAERLIKLANERGGHDNITALVLRIGRPKKSLTLNNLSFWKAKSVSFISIK
ncbi:MAG: Stp1/IreP family PP2C-type Ser/Thr phosphatase [Bacillota bacterium]